MRKLCSILFLFVSVHLSAQKQELLTYRQVVELALKNNFDIQIASNNTVIAATQNTYGNAGFLPKVDLNASTNFANNNTLQEFSSGLSVNQNNVASTNNSAGVYLSWTVFDGLKMFATKERLNLLQQQGELSFKIQLENTLEVLTLLYYQIVKQDQLMKGIQAAMDVSNERIRVANLRITVGSGSNVELLSAKLDLNAQRSNYITQKNALNEFKSQLLVVSGEETERNFSVDTFFVFDGIQSMNEIKEKIDKDNYAILFARKDILINQQQIKEIRAQNLPRVAINSSYLFGRSKNAAGFSLLNQNLGFNAGFSINWNLFNGFITRNEIKVSEIRLKNAFLSVDNTRLNLFSVASVAYIRWLGDKEIADLEEENIKLAEESLFITSERLKLGLGNFLEIKESQRSYEEAVTRLVTARYNLKVSETTLKKLTGELVR